MTDNLDNITKLQNLAFNPDTNSFNVNVVGNEGIIKGQVDYFADLPTASEYSGQLFYVKYGSGGYMSIVGVYKYPRSLYSSNGTIWEQTPLNVKMSEDSLTHVSIPIWSEYYNLSFDINIGDRIIYQEVLYSNLTGNQTLTTPDLDTTNWTLTNVDLLPDIIQLKAISKLDQILITDVDGSVPIAEVIQETNGISIDSNGHITFSQSGFYRVQVQLNISNTNNTEIDTWAEYWDGSVWADLPDSGNVVDSGNAHVGNFVIETTLSVNGSLSIRLKMRLITGAALLKFDTADGGIGVPSMTIICYKVNTTVKGLSVSPDHLTEDFKIGKVLDGNYSSWNTSGELRAIGAATQWDDLRTPVLSSKTGGSKEPSFDKIFDNSAGSQGVFTYMFDPSAEEELYFHVQMPHAWLMGSDIESHTHWVAKVDGNIGEKVEWGMEYTWTNIGETFPNTNIITGNISYPDEDIIANKHYLTELGFIDATNKSFSSMLICRVFRNATAVSDTYPNDAGLLEIDFHYQIDSLGSNEEYIKY